MIEKILLVIIIVTCLFSIGWMSNELYEDITLERQLNGLYMRNRDNWSSAMEIAKDLDKKGDWVCVNIKGMDYEKALEICNHEVGHEIFAEICEKNMSRCMGVLE